MNKNTAIALTIIIVIATIISAFYILNSMKPNSATSPNASENMLASQNPSKTLKEYFDDSGFSFKYPGDVEIRNIEVKDDITYSNLELISSVNGKISIKVTDTQFKSINEWFAKEGLKGKIEEIKIGEISGSQLQMDGKIFAGAINQNILFAIEVDTQNQEYWQSVYSVLLASFNFVAQKENNSIETQSLDGSDDAVLEEEIVE